MNFADRMEFLGISVNRLSLSDLMGLVGRGISTGKKWIIANHNLHSLYLFHRVAGLRSFFSVADWIHIDGMPLVALARHYGFTVSREHRVTYVDWTGPLMEAAATSNWRVFYLGSSETTIAKALPILRDAYPGLEITARSGYFDADRSSAENQSVLKDIASYRPNLLMVGMGMPRQELWIHANLADIQANVILPAGAALDYIAGTVPTPPRWAGRLGLEWAFRLVSEPRRLGSRYLVEPWSILILLLKDQIAGRRKLSSRQTKS
jgi:N-acetylglucosaminyldiphosphoundecaprenol N-acetyl-beta-D-mannosaminyltransferase